MNILETTTNNASVDLSAFGFGPAAAGPSFNDMLGATESGIPSTVNDLLTPAADTTSTVEDTTSTETGIGSEAASALENTDLDNPDTEPSTTTGRRKLEKDILVGYLADKVKAAEFSVFSDYDETKSTVEEYLAKQPEKRLRELLDENINLTTKSVEERLTNEFIQQEILGTLPPEFVQAYEYAKQGGTDWQGFYSAMGSAQQVTSLDPTRPEHQVQIAREYLTAIGFGDSTLIENEIAEYQETNKLAQKVAQFKPKLDQMYQEATAEYNRQQAEYNRQQEVAARQYMESVANTIKEGELFGIKIDKKKQSEIYRSLTVADQQSIYGGPTTALGAKIEKLLYVEPDPKKMAILDWLLTDENSFFAAMEQRGKNTQAADDFKKLKTIAATNTASTAAVETTATGYKKPVVKKLPNSFGDFFK